MFVLTPLPRFTEIIKYTFHLPEKLAGGQRPSAGPLHPETTPLLTSPAPACPITSFPRVRKISVQRDEQKGNFFIFDGEGFMPNLFVFFGDWKSPGVQHVSANQIHCIPPPPRPDGQPRAPLPVLLVRFDGIVYPTSHLI